MLLFDERKEICEYGRQLIRSGLTHGTGGNLSVMDSASGLFAITPSGIEYERLTPEDIVVMNLSGEVIEGVHKPSSEHALHSIFYKKRDDIKAVIHAHSEYATVLACLRRPLPPIHYLIALAGGEIRCAEYATFGTKELAENAFEAMEGNFAALLSNHGIVAGGRGLPSAFSKLEEIEYCARLYIRALQIGNPVLLDKDEIEKHFELFKTYRPL